MKLKKCIPYFGGDSGISGKNPCAPLQETSLRILITLRFRCSTTELYGRRDGLMVSVLDYGASGPGSGPGRGHCVVFLGKTLYSHGASPHSGV